MNARYATFSSLLVIGTLALSLSAGCGLKRLGPTVDPGDSPSPDPSTSSAPATGSVTPMPAPTAPVTPPAVTGNLLASLQGVQTTGFMFTRTVIATVQVINPSTFTLAGKVTCTFGKGTGTNQVQNQTVHLMAGEQRTLTFEEKSWFDKNAEVAIQTQQPMAPSQGAYPSYRNY